MFAIIIRDKNYTNLLPFIVFASKYNKYPVFGIHKGSIVFELSYPQEKTSSVLFQLTHTMTPTCLGSLKDDIFNFILQ